MGFEMIDKISQTEGILLNTIQSKALIGIGDLLNFCSVFLLIYYVTLYWVCHCLYRLLWFSNCSSYGLINAGSIGDVPILLAKPQAYMNYSGESVLSMFFSYNHKSSRTCGICVIFIVLYLFECERKHVSLFFFMDQTSFTWFANLLMNRK